ncbi:MAG TPA: ATP-binding cassette domain-containing protein [Thermoplasmatales archaeon]|nr:ATP-binding cassette domain-containing protein [Candidatus Thermoplasmatota archaeon]HDS59241.1 ATP-binding cassette domain-containing protein [Thermoplasmatales archaeon]
MSANTSDPAVVLRNIAAVYEGERVPAIYDINFTVKQGELVSIIGPNGAGKTTLLETINGLLAYTAGQGYVFGKDIAVHSRMLRKHIGYVIQNFDIDALAPFLARDVVMSGRVGAIGPLRFPRPSDWHVVRDKMELVGMSSFSSRPAGKLSGGEFQKLLLARALAQEPRLLLLDEPFSHLDISARRQMSELLSRVNRTQEVTMVMVSHDLQSVPAACSRVVVMDRGRIIMQGAREEMISSAAVASIFREGDT